MNNDYERLVGELAKWWTDNGWNLRTLKEKSVHELLRIRQGAINSKWAVKSHRRQAPRRRA